MTKDRDIKVDAICDNCRFGAEIEVKEFYLCQNSESDHNRHVLYRLHGCKDFKYLGCGYRKMPLLVTRAPDTGKE